MADLFHTLLLLAPPASGKSEVRTFLTNHDPEAFHMGDTVQLDDYPYVHLQLLVDEALQAMGRPRVFHHNDPDGQRNGPFMDPKEMAGLMYLLNDDYLEILGGSAPVPQNPAADLLRRFDLASEKAGAAVKFRDMDPATLTGIEKALMEEATAFYEEKAAACPVSLDGRTIVIEFARGGPLNATLPMTDGYGYQGSLPYLLPELLRRAAILYIWVTPRDSRRKNRERARPDGHGSILFHGTPESVMDQEYGSDDMPYLMETSDIRGTLRLQTATGVVHVPVSRFDNRADLTSFLRRDPALWTDAEIAAIKGGLAAATDALWTTCTNR